MTGRGTVYPPMWLFLRDQEDGSWMGVIVAKTDRTLRDNPDLAEVISFNRLSSRRAVENWAAEIMGPLGETDYVAPELRN